MFAGTRLVYLMSALKAPETSNEPIMMFMDNFEYTEQYYLPFLFPNCIVHLINLNSASQLIISSPSFISIPPENIKKPAKFSDVFREYKNITNVASK